MSDSNKKSTNGTVDQIIEHIAADIQNADGQYIQLGFTPPPTPNDGHIWSEFGQNQVPQNPFVHFANRSPENLPYIDPNTRYVQQNVPYNNYIPQNPIFVPDMPSNFENMNKYVLYQQQNPQFSYNYMPIFENRSEVYPNPEILNQNRSETIKNKIILPTTQNRTHLIENLVCNWSQNTNGTYSPFGNVQNQSSSTFFDHKLQEMHPEKPENFDLKKPVSKKKQVAEVKPMRPTYSDVLTKSVPPQIPKTEKIETKDTKKQNQPKKGSKNEKFAKINTNRQNSNGEKENRDKFLEKNDPKVNLSRKWVSLDDVNDVHSTTKDFLKAELNNEVQNSSLKNKKSKNVPGKNDTKNFKKTFADNTDLGCQWTENEDKENLKNEERNLNKNPNKKEKQPRSNSAKQNRFSDKFNEKPPNSAKRAQRIRKKDNNNSFGIFGRNVQHYINRWSKIILSCLLWFLNLISDIFLMSIHLGRDLGTFLVDNFLIYSKALSQNCVLILKRVKIFTKIGNFIDKNLGNSRWAFWNKWTRSNEQKSKNNESEKYWLNSGLEHNINMPTTGEEAMKRLLACKGKDPYSILGVRPDCTDDDIKRYYKRQAFLVHPDKNPQPGAEEAFKILVHAFDIIGEPERRQSYDRKVAESHQVEQAWSELNDLLSQLHQKMEYAANTIRCTNCTKRHRRVAVDRPCYAARFCSQCKIHHSAKEGDIWAEATCWGFLWHYYACMDGAVYDITEWAGCQRKNLKHLRPNSHNVQYRIVLGKQAQQGPQNGQSPTQGSQRGRKNGANEREADLESFLNNLYSQSDLSASGTGNASQQPETGNSASKNRKKNKKRSK